MKIIFTILIMLFCVVIWAEELTPQKFCPVMGGKINKEYFTDFHGLRIYFCCPGCDKEFLNNPFEYVKKMRQSGFEPEHLNVEDEVVQTKCPVMGGDINKEYFTDYNGQRVYFCCLGCEDSFLKEPEKYIEKMKQAGELKEKSED